jgi:hypothetical protein
MDEIDSSITYPPNPGRMVGYFTMENWAPVSGEEDVVAEKTYNRSSTEYENSLYEEHTTIRFTQ